MTGRAKPKTTGGITVPQASKLQKGGLAVTGGGAALLSWLAWQQLVEVSRDQTSMGKDLAGVRTELVETKGQVLGLRELVTLQLNSGSERTSDLAADVKDHEARIRLLEATMAVQAANRVNNK